MDSFIKFADYISAKSARQIVSTNDWCTSRFSNFLLIGFCKFSVNFLVDLI